jgi:transposase-like protein
MMLRCDYCRDKLGLNTHRYWHMRFCCSACAQAYQRRLTEPTRLKIDDLDVAVNDNLLAFGSRLRPRGDHPAR